jgi:asparagine synthetase A
LYEVSEVMFHVDQWPWELIICFRDVLKNDFFEVAEAMFQGVERTCEIIFCILCI